MQFTAIDYNETTDQWNITMTGSEWPWMMKQPKVRCPHCGTANIHINGNYIKGGKRYECLNAPCKRYFIVK